MLDVINPTKPLTTPPKYFPARETVENPLAPRNSKPVPRRRLSKLAPDAFLLNQASTIYNTHREPEEERVRLWALLIKRHRGSNLSEQIGVFSPHTGKYLDVDASNIKPLNIIEPAVRANTSTMTQANVALKVEPATSKQKGAAAVSRSVYEYLENRDWTEQLEYRCADLSQLSSAAFIKVSPDEYCDSPMTVPDIIDTAIEGQGKYVCPSCGLSGNFDAKDLVKLEADNKTSFEPDFFCPECGARTEIEEMPETSFVPTFQFTQQNAAQDVATRVYTSFEIRMDERGTEGGRLEGGEYFEHHFLMSRCEIEEEYPHIKLGAPETPCYSLRWQHALQHGLRDARESWFDFRKGEQDTDLFEVREIYLKPSRYKSYYAPSSWQLKDDETQEVVFDVQTGETWDDALQRYGQKPKKGICIVVINNRIAGVKYADYTQEWSIIQFAPDAFSAWARPFAIILPISNDVTTINTLMMLHLEKNSIANVVVDSDMFDFEDFENDFVPTRAGKHLDTDIRHHFAVVNPPQLGAEPVNYMGFLLKLKDDLSGVQPATVGASQPGQPYAAQLLQVNQSQGLLSPYMKSKAQGKVTWLRNCLKAVQAVWSEERFREIESQYGEEWKDSDLEDFYNCDIDKDILITYIEGSEVPKTLMQREIKLQNFIAQTAQFMQLAPGAITPQMVQELVAQLAGYSDVEFDIGNFEGDKRLARTRLERLREAVALFMQQGFQIPFDMETGVPQLQPVAMHIISQAKCVVNPKAENHPSHKEFWSDQIRALQADDEQNELLMACFDAMWTQHDAAEVTMAQLQLQNQMAAQAPAQAQALQQQEQQVAGQLAEASAEEEAESAASEQQAQAEAERLELEARDKLLDIADREAERENRLELEAMKQGN